MHLFHSHRDRERFHSQHTVLTGVGADKKLLIQTGLVDIGFQGVSHDWRTDELRIVVNFSNILPRDTEFSVEQWTVLVTMNKISNEGHAINSGYSVRTFGLHDPRSRVNEYEISATIDVRDRDGFLSVVGYQVNLLGDLRSVEPDPIF